PNDLCRVPVFTRDLHPGPPARGVCKKGFSMLSHAVQQFRRGVGLRRKQQLKNEAYPVRRGQWVWLDRRTCRKAKPGGNERCQGKLMGTLAYATEILGIPEWALRAALKKGSRFFDGQRLVPERATPPYPRRTDKVLVWPVAKLEELRDFLALTTA